jgi:TPP-dependent pyruvate/acetoin dehydrogenase alpha subunit
VSEARALPGGLEGAQAADLLREMRRIRGFEEKCAALYGEAKIRGFLHLYVGEEAVAVGVLRAAAPEDAVVATYREHGHALARGVPMGAILAEMYGKVEGCSRGRGGSMHLFDAARRFYGGNAIVGGGLPVAVGLALADRLAGRRRVTFCFFGEGAVAEGEFHESLNLAIGVHAATGVDVPEVDYPRLASIDAWVAYLAQRLRAAPDPRRAGAPGAEVPV